METPSIIQECRNEDSIGERSISIVKGKDQNGSFIYNFTGIENQPVKIRNGKNYIDEQFQLSTDKLENNIKIRRLASIFPINTSIFLDLKTGKQLSKPTYQKINPSKPTYLSQLNILPFAHYCKLIQPTFINPQGYYYIIILRNGILVKEIIDDTFYFDQSKGNLVAHHAELQNHPWVHILVKMWAKLNRGYNNLYRCNAFEFIRTFSFPDWQVMNPSKQGKQWIIKKLGKATRKNQLIIAQTKNNPKVGYYGFTPNCASFVVNGHYQEYGDLYIKIIPFTYDRWNMAISSNDTGKPEQMPKLDENEFLMPLQQFCNVFHLLYSTSNKYYEREHRENEQFNAPSMNFQSKVTLVSYAKCLGRLNSRIYDIQISSQHQDYKFVQVGLSLYFPPINKTNYQTNLPNTSLNHQIPWCKFMLGTVNDASNLQVKYMQSVQEIVMDPGQNQLDFVTRSNRYDYIAGEYFKGYGNYMTKNLVLKTGKYLMSVNIQQKLKYYEYFVNATSINGSTKISQSKHEQNQQKLLLQDCLFHKAIDQRKFITFVNPKKKGSWISCRNQHEVLGYGYIAVHVVKNNIHNIIIRIQPELLKSQGYVVKNPKGCEDYTIVVSSDENALIILKQDEQWKKSQKRKWLPSGIEFLKILNKKN